MRRILIVAALCLLASRAAPALQVDALLESLTPTGHVNDFAGVIGSQAEPIESLLTELEQKTGAQVAVVTLASLEGAEIDDFAVRLFERWGIGQADEDNGVLILTAIEDRDIRIEVGYGLEPVINDALAGRILDQAVLPYFRQNDYASGLAGGAATIASLIAQEAGVELTGTQGIPVQNVRREDRSPLGGLLGLLVLLFLIPLLLRNPWLALLLLSGGRGGGFGGGGGGFGRGGGGFGGFGGGMSGGGGASRSW